jgi:hypothetical protein
VDTLPANAAPGDDLTFGGGTAGAIIDLGGARFANSLAFTRNYTLGLAATTNTLTLATAPISISTGVTGTINAVVAGTNGLSLTGGGTLFLNRATLNTFTAISPSTGPAPHSPTWEPTTAPTPPPWVPELKPLL